VEESAPRQRGISEAAHGTWLLLFPSQIAEAEEGHEVGFWYPIAGGGGIQAGFQAVSGELGGVASETGARSKPLGPGGGGKQRFSFVPVTDIRTPSVGLVNTFCGAVSDQRVLVRFELTSLPPGVQNVQAAKVRGSRLAAPSAPELTKSFTSDELLHKPSRLSSTSTDSCYDSGTRAVLSTAPPPHSHHSSPSILAATLLRSPAVAGALSEQSRLRAQQTQSSARIESKAHRMRREC